LTSQVSGTIPLSTGEIVGIVLGLFFGLLIGAFLVGRFIIFFIQDQKKSNDGPAVELRMKGKKPIPPVFLKAMKDDHSGLHIPTFHHESKV
jgi:hypothetical protein